MALLLDVMFTFSHKFIKMLTMRLLFMREFFETVRDMGCAILSKTLACESLHYLL